MLYLFYFPIIHSEKELTIKKCLNCCLALGESHNDIVTKLQKENLPIFDYRTTVELQRSIYSAKTAAPQVPV